jgi:hypothetical protein
MVSIHGRLLRSVLGVAVGSAALCIMFCAKDNPLKPVFENSWTFSGTVLDGSSGSALSGVTIDYLDSADQSRTETTDANGNFAIRGNLAGEHNFAFSSQSKVV